MNDTTTMTGSHLVTLTPREARYKAALEEIRKVAEHIDLREPRPSAARIIDVVDIALDESTFAP